MDNSFLIEEAYNQEYGVVQHISTFARNDDLDAWSATFTQEWPLGSQRNQLGFTLPYMREGDSGGIGDIALHYRRQLREIHPQLAISPRFSVMLPTGRSEGGFGKGSPGLEVALPVSYILNDHFYAHTNGGMTLTPTAKAPNGSETAIFETFIGQSLVWLAHPRLNLLLELAWDTEETPLSNGAVLRSENFFLSPGVRGAINLSSGMQIVPGIAIPIGVGPSRGDRAVFLYLSVEHAFRR
ncbi:MAG TPA: hypothetical protein VMM77_02105 [Gemmatimonadaceae bacterium]|nr:hypothetical protein [Gemmatimonadaceae bacterium]